MLYHYTSIETLAMILGGKKIRFNNLLHVDDPDEIETADLSNWGRHCFVSCWTKSADDVLSEYVYSGYTWGKNWNAGTAI